MGTTSFIYKNSARSVANKPVLSDEAPRFIFPWMTAFIIVAYFVIYMIEERLVRQSGWPGEPPKLGILVALGGLSRNLLSFGEEYRLLAAPFLHRNMQDFLQNMLVLAFAGYLLEWKIGAAWMFCAVAAGAFAGSAMSIMLDLPTTVTVGASGVIMAMLLTLLVISFRWPPSSGKTRIQGFVALLVIFQLIPLASVSATSRVDAAASLGGGLVGFALGLWFLLTWPKDGHRPALPLVAILLSGIFFCWFASIAHAVVMAYPGYENLVQMMPDELMPHTPADVVANAQKLRDAYPNDPRSHYVMADAELMRNNPVAAEQELRAGLAMADAKVGVVYPALNNTIRALLAQAVLMQGRQREALAIATNPCVAHDVTAPPPELRAQLVQSKLCW